MKDHLLPEEWHKHATEADWITYQMWMEEAVGRVLFMSEYIPTPALMRKELLLWLTDEYGWKDNDK